REEPVRRGGIETEGTETGGAIQGEGSGFVARIGAYRPRSDGRRTTSCNSGNAGRANPRLPSAIRFREILEMSIAVRSAFTVFSFSALLVLPAFAQSARIDFAQDVHPILA